MPPDGRTADLVHHGLGSESFMSHLIRITFAGTLIVCLGLYACSSPTSSNTGGVSQSADSLQLCNGAIPRTDLANVLDGTMFIVASYDKDGARLTSIAGGLLFALAYNGINLDSLDTYGLGFNNGVYSFTTPGHSLRLVFFFAQDFGNFQAGDTIPYDLFDAASYVANVSLNTSGVSYDKGPLWGLIQGGISWDKLKPVFSLNTTLISFTLQSTSDYSNSFLGIVDSMHLVMTTVPATLQKFAAQVDAGGFGFSYDSSSYTSRTFGISESVYGSTFYMKRLDSTWYWTGFYRGSVVKNKYRFYLHGLATNIGPNYTGFYCDPAFADSFGVAEDDTSLTFGHFYSVAGDTVTYILLP